MMNNFIKYLMLKHNIKQKELADILGIKSSAISQWKSPSGIATDCLYTISKLFGISIDNLLNEQIPNETLEEKLYRQYNIEDIDIDGAIEERDTQSIITYTQKIRAMTENLYPLLYKKITQGLSHQENEELKYIKTYFEVNAFKSTAYFNDTWSYPNDVDEDIIIGKRLSSIFDPNDRKSIVWELKKIYNNKHIIEYQDWFPDEAIKNIFLCYSPLKQDLKATEAFDNMDFDRAYAEISLGAHLLYNYKSLPSINYSQDEFKKFQGQTKHLKHLDDAKVAYDNSCNMYHIEVLYYNEYIKLINHNAMKKLEMQVKYINKTPYKFWEYIKKEEY